MDPGMVNSSVPAKGRKGFFRNSSSKGRSSNNSTSPPVRRASMPDLKSCMSVSSLEESLHTIKEENNRSDTDTDDGAAAAILDSSRHSCPAILLQPNKVSFDTIEIREYERTLTYNPAVTSGPAIGIGWNYDKSGQFDLEQYEQSRPPRREGETLQMPRRTREDMLREQCGYSRGQMQQAIQEISVVKTNRRKTAAMMEVEGASIMLESMGRKFQKFMGTRSNSKKQQEELWKNAATDAKPQTQTVSPEKRRSSTSTSSTSTRSCLLDPVPEDEVHHHDSHEQHNNDKAKDQPYIAVLNKAMQDVTLITTTTSSEVEATNSSNDDDDWDLGVGEEIEA